MRCTFNEFRTIQIDRDCWVTDYEFIDDIFIPGEEPTTMQLVVDRVLCEAITEPGGKHIRNEVLHNFTASFILHPHHWWHWNRCFVFTTWLYYPTERPGQRRRLASRRLRRTTFLSLRKTLLSRSEISPRTKLRIYRLVVRRVLTYAYETWPLRLDGVQRLESFDHYMAKWQK